MVVEDEKRSLGKKIKEDLGRLMEQKKFAQEKVLPLFAGWKACEATDILYFAINEIKKNAIIRG